MFARMDDAACQNKKNVTVTYTLGNINGMLRAFKTYMSLGTDSFHRLLTKTINE